jgi:nitroreductase
VPGGDGQRPVSEQFFDVAGRQRACRAFLADPVGDDVVARVLETATRAPSAENTQPWAFVVVRDPDRRAAIGDLARRAWARGGRAHSEGRLSPALLAEVERGAVGGVADAPVLVVVCGDTRLTSPTVLGASVYPAVQNMLLAATALGLGSALTTLPMVFEDELCALVGLPDGVRPFAVVPLGWPARAYGPSKRQPISEKAFAETYGSPLRGPGS